MIQCKVHRHLPTVGSPLVVRTNGRPWASVGAGRAVAGRPERKLIMAETDPAVLVGTIGAAYLDSRCLHVVADLGVADALGDGPRALASLAGELGVDEAALGRILRHLASLGVFDFHDGSVHPNAASRLLRSDDPSGMLAMTRMFALPIMWDSLRSLEGSVRTGRPGASFRDPDGFFAYLDRHPEESRIYDEGMTSMTLRRIDRIAPNYDFSGFGIIADVGGGRGHLLRAILDRTPGATGILFDRAQVLDGLEPGNRMTIQAGNFLDGHVPTADAYLLSNIIHDWDDDSAIAILTAIRSNAKATSRLLLFEFIVPDDAGPFDASDIDVWMLALVGGRERRLVEYRNLLERAGWSLLRTIPTESQTILEAATA